MHDIGKIGIPLEILNKPTSLNNAEWDVMKSHAVKEYEIACASPELQGVAELILHHHESWDDTGYPHGLKGERIPLLSRIISVVDAYDAMTHDRPYRKAMTSMEARQELQRCSGQQFDPELVEAFLEVLDDNPQLAVSDEDERQTHAALFGNLEATHSPEEPDARPLTPKDNDSARLVAHGRYFLDENNVIISIDEGFTHIAGYTEADIKRCTLSQRDLIVPEEFEWYAELVANEIEATGEAYMQHRLIRKDGTICTVLCLGRNFYDPVSRAMRAEIIITEIG